MNVSLSITVEEVIFLYLMMFDLFHIVKMVMPKFYLLCVLLL